MVVLLSLKVHFTAHLRVCMLNIIANATSSSTRLTSHIVDQLPPLQHSCDKLHVQLYAFIVLILLSLALLIHSFYSSAVTPNTSAHCLLKHSHASLLMLTTDMALPIQTRTLTFPASSGATFSLISVTRILFRFLKMDLGHHLAQKSKS